jgi:hypothetical protein
MMRSRAWGLGLPPGSDAVPASDCCACERRDDQAAGPHRPRPRLDTATGTTPERGSRPTSETGPESAEPRPHPRPYTSQELMRLAPSRLTLSDDNFNSTRSEWTRAFRIEVLRARGIVSTAASVSKRGFPPRAAPEIALKRASQLGGGVSSLSI